MSDHAKIAAEANELMRMVVESADTKISSDLAVRIDKLLRGQRMNDTVLAICMVLSRLQEDLDAISTREGTPVTEDVLAHAVSILMQHSAAARKERVADKEKTH